MTCAQWYDPKLLVIRYTFRTMNDVTLKYLKQDFCLNRMTIYRTGSSKYKRQLANFAHRLSNINRTNSTRIKAHFDAESRRHRTGFLHSQGNFSVLAFD